MALGVFQAMKGQGSIEDLLRAIPDALRPLLVFDCLSLSLDRGPQAAPRRYVLVEDAVPDRAAQGLQSACTAPLAAPQRTLGTLEIASRRAHAYSPEDARLLSHCRGDRRSAGSKCRPAWAGSAKGSPPR